MMKESKYHLSTYSSIPRKNCVWICPIEWYYEKKSILVRSSHESIRSHNWNSRILGLENIFSFHIFCSLIIEVYIDTSKTLLTSKISTNTWPLLQEIHIYIIILMSRRCIYVYQDQLANHLVEDIPLIQPWWVHLPVDFETWQMENA